MKYLAFFPVAMVLGACAETSPSSSCDAVPFQYIVGMSAQDAFEEMDKQPASIKNQTIYSGSSETPRMLPRGKLVLEHSTPNVIDALTKGGTVTKVYCNS